MTLRFRQLAILVTLLFVALALVWMFAPQLLLASWGVASTPASILLARRAAALYAAVAVMFWLARNAPASPARHAMSMGLMTACLILAALGVAELASGHTTSGILGAVVIEVALALLLWRSIYKGEA